MTLSRFNQLSEDQQARALQKQGVFISLRKTRLHKVLLYQVDGFYVEVYYHPKRNEITGFRSFAATEHLETYLEQINLDGIV